MGRFALLGMGWHSWLFREEMRAIVGEVDLLHPRVVSCKIEAETLGRLSGSALLDEVLIFGGCHELNDSPEEHENLFSEIADWAMNSMGEGSFAIRTRKIGELPDSLSSRAFERSIGKHVANHDRIVDLESPENEVVVIIAGSNEINSHPEPIPFSGTRIIWGIKEMSWEKEDFSGRSPTERPFFKPVSLEPRQARLLISLSNVKGRELKAIIDPFCGTGGIAIEGCLQDIEVLASDLDSRMVEGTISNLKWLGKKGTVEKYDASEIFNLWGEREGSCFVFDPPYGRSSWRSDDSIEVFLRTLREARKIDPAGVVSTMLPAGPEALTKASLRQAVVMGRPWSELVSEIESIGWRVHLLCPVRVHRSLVRVIAVFHPSD